MGEKDPRFKPGQSGNPGGRPKVTEDWKEMLTAKTPEVLFRLLQLTKHPREQIALKAIEIALSYSLPKPKQEQSIELTGFVGGIDAPSDVDEESWLERKRSEILAKSANGTNGHAK